jgi:hypothetical protein
VQVQSCGNQHCDLLRKLVLIGSPRSYSFLWAWKGSAANIHQTLTEVNGINAVSRQQVAKWCSTFAFGTNKMMDDKVDDDAD